MSDIKKYLIDYEKIEVGDKLWSIQLGDCTMRGIGLNAQWGRMIVCANAEGLEVNYTEKGFYSKKDKFPSLFTSNPFAEGDPYSELKEAHAAGKTIEFNYDAIGWAPPSDISWSYPPEKYRVKPEIATEPTPGKTATFAYMEESGPLNQDSFDRIHQLMDEAKRPTKPESILQEAERLINGDRREAYGDAKENFGDIAKGWSVLFKTHVTAEQVAIAMIWLKMCRFNHKEGRDSIVDIAGYAGCLEKIMKGGTK